MFNLKSKKYWLETAICSARKGRDARLHRMLERRQLLRKRSEGCLEAWVARSMDGQAMFIVQAIYENEKSWRSVNERIETELDSKDGGFQDLLSGPPLVGIFALDEEELPSGPQNHAT